MPCWKEGDSPNVTHVSFGMCYGNEVIRHDEKAMFESVPASALKSHNAFRDESTRYSLNDENEYYMLQYENSKWDVVDSY